MNIALLITQKLDPTAGGVQKVTSNLSEIFISNHHKTIIISFGNHVEKEEEFNNMPLYYINNKNTEKLTHILKKEEIDIIINQRGYSVSQTKLLLSTKSIRTKLINCLHINPLNFYKNHKLFIANSFDSKGLGFLNNKVTQKFILFYHIIKQRIELNYIIKNTDAFIMLSEYFKPELYTLAPRLKKYDTKIYGISNPFEQPKLDIAKLEKENIILFVGRLNVLQKRVDLLLEVWKKLHTKLPDWKFWVLGDGESRGYMENFCNEHNLDRITFFGKDNPDDYYKKAKIFHMTSAFEGFGNVLVEAQSYGCVPVLFNSYSAAQDIVTHEEDGILVAPFDIDEYVSQTISLVNNPSKLKQMSLDAYKNMQKFSYDETYKKWSRVFEEISK